jgi:hypothetical protein
VTRFPLLFYYEAPAAFSSCCFHDWQHSCPGHFCVGGASAVGAATEALVRVEELTGKKVDFIEMDLLQEEALKQLFVENDFGGVIHFAGLKVRLHDCTWI